MDFKIRFDAFKTGFDAFRTHFDAFKTHFDAFKIHFAGFKTYSVKSIMRCMLSRLTEKGSSTKIMLNFQSRSHKILMLI